MKTITLVSLFALALSACATAPHPVTAPTDETISTPTAQLVSTVESAPAPTSAADPEQTGLLRVQDRLNLFASPRYLAHVQAAKDAGADQLQVACMDATVEIGADLRARPLLTPPTADLGPVDRSCGWCVLAAKRKADAARSSGPSVLVQVADARKRLAGLARKGLVACAPLREDMRLSLLNPENAAAGLFELLNLFGGGD